MTRERILVKKLENQATRLFIVSTLMIGPDNILSLILGLTLSAQQVLVEDRRNYIYIQNRSKIKASVFFK